MQPNIQAKSLSAGEIEPKQPVIRTQWSDTISYTEEERFNNTVHNIQAYKY